MSYRGFGAGYAPPSQCADYIVSSDGRCADHDGMHQARWFSLAQGRCVVPPPINCEADPGENLPSSCPPGQKLFSGSASGCMPVSGSGGATGASSEPSKAGLGILAIILGVGIMVASKRK